MELDRAERMGGPLSVVMVDIDHFKKINDQFGHPAGDVVLRSVASRLSEAVRVYDSVGRLGGEEFIMVLPGCDARLGMVVAERLRRTLAAERVSTARGPVKVTVSLGVASTNEFR
jgi:diguanylate cyclase (GGDEF)-like protein